MRFIYKARKLKSAAKLILDQAAILEEEVHAPTRDSIEQLQRGIWTGQDAQRFAERIEKRLLPQIRQLITALHAFQPTMEKMERSVMKADLALTKEIMQINQRFSLDYLGLQQKMQQENREFNMLSNVMKSKHDSAKDAINNIR
ncbi:MAG: hypothetical protein ACLFWD_06225 [Anaerolineales bacterium]